MPCVPRNPSVDPGVTRDAGAMRLRRHSRPPELRLRKSRRMNVGWANCSTLFSIDTHELPFGSIPPVAPALAISSAGLAPNAAEDNTHTRAMTATTAIARSARPEMAIRGASNKNYVRRVHFRWSYLFSLAVSRRQFCANAQLYSSMLLRDSLPRQDKLSYLIEWHRLTLVPHQSHIPSRQACGVGIGLPSL